MAPNEGGGGTAAGESASAAARPKRVRTGCLTCRERHLKCDEGLPECQNCRKSSRACKRGVRLNFIDTQVKNPPITPPTQDWDVAFQDESREIASEYRGGLGRYAALPQETEETPEVRDEALYQFSSGVMNTPTLAPQQLPSLQQQSLPAENLEPYPAVSQRRPDNSREQHIHSADNTDSTFTSQTIPPPPISTYNSTKQTLTPPSEDRGPLDSPEELLFMQVFVEEVGLWMDSLDPYKHFSRLLPFESLHEPMLLNAFLACGARHLALVNPIYSEDKALHYYDDATTRLLEALQNPNRDTVICATTAVILNVYEIMSERPLQRMNHIAGARALIKECRWTAKTRGVGAACFWINVGMELLSCIRFNWQVAWDPDLWGVDMDFSREIDYGREEGWTYRLMYIVAKIANFRSSAPRQAESTQHAEQVRLQNRFNEWNRLKDWIDSWNNASPRTLRPMGYLYPHQTTSKSAFPEVWLIKRTSIVARLFYHTGMCLLAQTHPVLSTRTPEMHDLQQSHAHDLCGIVAHNKDRGVASVAIRSLAIAAECLVSRREQEEVLEIFDRIQKETGWRTGFLHKELKEKWGWNNEEQYQQQQQQNMAAPMLSMQNYPYPASSLPPAPPPLSLNKGPPKGIINPILRNADFSAPSHPYQSHYIAPLHLPTQQPHYNHY
ncbi:MAG: hypothetical protein Q9184_004522 [Pyrenodesmia sp. 2 TL-2023]